MGCDIHVFVEGKKNGNWYFLKEDEIGRDYKLFGKIAGVRIPDDNSLDPKGLPNNVSEVVKIIYKEWGNDAHNASYMSAKKAKKFPALKIDISDLCQEDLFDKLRIVFWFDN